MSHHQRRQLLIGRMKELNSLGFNCTGCAGNCCTSEANSMMVTPIEAMDLFTYLKQNNLLDQELRKKCEDTIKLYRLDQGLGNGRRSFIRRTYTCPFFNHRELGCPLPVEVKPYGCLAFNSHHPTEKTGNHCHSEIELLEERERSSLDEEIENELLRKELQLFWEKLPLPMALLELWEKEIIPDYL